MMISFLFRGLCFFLPVLFAVIFFDHILYASFLSLTMVLLCPVEGEKNLISILLFLSLPLVSFLTAIFDADLTLLENAIFLSFQAFRKVSLHYSRAVSLFNNESLRSGLFLDSCLLYSFIAVEVQLFYSVLPSNRVVDVSVFLFTIFLVIVCFLRVSMKRSFIISFSKENEISSLIRGNLRNVDIPEGLDDRKMSSLYKKAVKKMKEEEIYEREDFDLEFFARELYTNKVYLSKTINVYSGRNFSQFVNYFRIEKVLELLKSDTGMRIESAGLQVGFRSVSSFNIAFKMYKGITPREWLERYREGELR